MKNEDVRKTKEIKKNRRRYIENMESDRGNKESPKRTNYVTQKNNKSAICSAGQLTGGNSVIDT